MATEVLQSEVQGGSASLIALRDALAKGLGKRVARFRVADLGVEVRASHDSVWALVRRGGEGGLALRLAYLTGEFRCTAATSDRADGIELAITSALGEHRVRLRAGGEGRDNVRATTRFTPAVPTVLPFTPRDLYPLDAEDDPLAAKGGVDAVQRGPNSGQVFFHLDEPAFGRVLYFQNFTALNDYFLASRTEPSETVGGCWPELGYLMPPAAEPDAQLAAASRLRCPT
jgi:hypothetical protein